MTKEDTFVTRAGCKVKLEVVGTGFAISVTQTSGKQEVYALGSDEAEKVALRILKLCGVMF